MVSPIESAALCVGDRDGCIFAYASESHPSWRWSFFGRDGGIRWRRVFDRGVGGRCCRCDGRSGSIIWCRIGLFCSSLHPKLWLSPVRLARVALLSGVMEQPSLMEVLAVGDERLLVRPCVDCGLITGGYCDYCLAEMHAPDEEWCENQHTPLCSKCDIQYYACHFCRGLSWVTPPPHR